MKNLYIARTPLQLMNATEARNRFHSSDTNILFCIYRKDIDKKLMLNIIDHKWQEIKWFKLNIFSRNFYQVLLFTYLKKHAFVNNIYIGLYGNIISHIINTISYEEIIIYDDGNEIIKIAQAINDKNLKKSKFIHKIIGKKTDNKFLYKAKFFSLYDLSQFGVNYIHNDYREFKKEIQNIKSSKHKIYFIGSNLIPNYLTKEKFIMYMKKIIEYYKDYDFIYILHRYENKSLFDELGIKSVKFENIIEFEFLTQKVIPYKIISFRSTALDTLKTLYGIPIEIIKVKIDDFKDSKKTEMKQLYKYYQNKNIPILDI
jgi:hypothetical protein